MMEIEEGVGVSGKNGEWGHEGVAMVKMGEPV